jgi:hypothetical protein
MELGPAIVSFSSLFRIFTGVYSLSELLFNFDPSFSLERFLEFARIPALSTISSSLIVSPLTLVDFISLLIPVHFSVSMHFVVHPSTVVVFSIGIAVLSLTMFSTSNPVSFIIFCCVKVGVLILKFLNNSFIDYIGFSSISMGFSLLKGTLINISIGPSVDSCTFLLVVQECSFVNSLVHVDNSTVSVTLMVFPLPFINFSSLLAEINSISIELLTIISLTSVLVFVIEFTVSYVVSRF